MPYTNDFKDLSGASPEMVKRGQREVVLAAVQRTMFCQITGKLLDRKSTVVLMPSNGPMVVITAALWDEKQDDVMAAAGSSGATVEVYDGRELWS